MLRGLSGLGGQRRDASRVERVAVTTYADIPAGTIFQFRHGGCTYVKLDDDRYQLVGADMRPVPAMTYRLKHRGGQTDPVLPR